MWLRESKVVVVLMGSYFGYYIGLEIVVAGGILLGTPGMYAFFISSSGFQDC